MDEQKQLCAFGHSGAHYPIMNNAHVHLLYSFNKRYDYQRGEYAIQYSKTP